MAGTTSQGDQGIAVSQEQADFLARMPHAIFATQRRGGSPQLSPVWYLWDGARIAISTRSWTAKARNARTNTDVSVCIDDPASGMYATVHGSAAIIEGASVHLRTLPLLRKYLSLIHI